MLTGVRQTLRIESSSRQMLDERRGNASTLMDNTEEASVGGMTEGLLGSSYQRISSAGVTDPKPGVRTFGKRF